MHAWTLPWKTNVPQNIYESSSQKVLWGQIQIGKLAYFISSQHTTPPRVAHILWLWEVSKKEICFALFSLTSPSLLTSPLRKTPWNILLGSLSTLTYCGLYQKYLSSVPQHPCLPINLVLLTRWDSQRILWLIEMYYKKKKKCITYSSFYCNESTNFQRLRIQELKTLRWKTCSYWACNTCSISCWHFSFIIPFNP